MDFTTFLKWAFVPQASNPKHRSFVHPFFSMVFTTSITWKLTQYLAIKIEEGFPSIPGVHNAFAPLPSWGRMLVPFLFGYLALMLATRLKQTGVTAFYEMMWACNQAIIMMIRGLLINSPLIIGAGVVIISIDQCLWYVDMLGFITLRKFPVGVAKYITWPSTTKLRLLTSTHHLWFIPLLLSLLRNTPQLNHQAFYFSFILTAFYSVLGRLMVPRYIKQDGKEDLYMNINLSYELWKDVKIKFLSKFDRAPGIIVVPFSNIIWNAGNYIFFLILRFILNCIR